MNRLIYLCAALTLLMYACRKETTNTSPDEFASFVLGDQSYCLSSPSDSLVYIKDPQRTIIKFFSRTGENVSINVTLWDTIPTTNRGFVIIGANGLAQQSPGAYYTITKYGVVNEYIECDLNGIIQGPSTPFTGHVRVKRRS